MSSYRFSFQKHNRAWRGEKEGNKKGKKGKHFLFLNFWIFFRDLRFVFFRDFRIFFGIWGFFWDLRIFLGGFGIFLGVYFYQNIFDLFAPRKKAYLAWRNYCMIPLYNIYNIFPMKLLSSCRDSIDQRFHVFCDSCNISSFRFFLL